ncbi:MAG: DEAD/DEAH box helicase [Bacteroidota bacterium]|jgi:ATP-dependent RNA helicase RhlE|nr:DEAD/DEAH box helicase [Bacteroidota bacterium]MCA6442100.1 DEAD/DEAH box helicase [Bacteroidota bacterium]
MTFKELSLIEPLLAALNSIGYQQPTPIQEKAITPILNNQDIFGCAQTGTGKTAAFMLPILQQLSIKPTSKSIRALVLAPTRELAIQIGENVEALSVNLKLKHTVIFGGVSQKNQERALRSGIDILIATPGRLLDLMQQGIIKIDAIEHFVLDEADRMLDMGFIHDIKKIIVKLPIKRQTLFFSATAAPDIMKLATSLLKNPVHIQVAPVSSTASLVEQSLYYVAKENKRSLLKHLLQHENVEHALVFTRTKRGADRVAKELNKNGITSESIHGDKSQGARVRALNGFKNRVVRVLVATDIAARGIDVDKLTHVINYEIPEVAETYVHRIGRTGRAGSAGKALSFCDSDELAYMKDITKLIKQTISVVSSHPYTN